MKKLLFLIVFLIILAPVSLFSQSHIFEYSYDDSGNRTEKSIIYLRKKLEGTTNYDSALNKENIGNYAISVLPNPTKGVVKVEVENFDSQFDASAFIFSEAGKFLSKDQKLESSNVFDFTGKPSGIYFLKIISENGSKTWKIIKL